MQRTVAKRGPGDDNCVWPSAYSEEKEESQLQLWDLRQLRSELTTMAAGDVGLLKAVNRLRPQTPQDFTLLKAIRYEDAKDGVPPVPVASLNPPTSPSASSTNSAAATVKSQADGRRPRTSPSPRSTATVASDSLKRDSGIAPSFSTLTRTSYAESSISSPVVGAAKEPTLPTILIQDDESPPPIERTRSPFARRKSKEKAVRKRSSSVPRGIQRIASFKGINSEIPSGIWDDIDLEDLATDKVDFTKRGSLLLGGQKMNELIGMHDNGEARQNGTIATPSKHDTTAPAPSTSAKDEPKRGLVSGRRKPSIHMLQAAIDGGRVLSAEEITFSMRVRSMYDAGDEKAAQWVTPVQTGNTVTVNGVNGGTNGSPPDTSIDSIVNGKRQHQRQQDVHPALRSPTPNPRNSYCKETTELAGGIEDWEDVHGTEVDRYGFISRNRSSTPNSPQPGMQRVATSLQVESNQPRRSRGLRRGPSTATRTSKSLPPKSSGEGTVRNGSMHSAQSNISMNRLHSGNPFRSRSRRTLEEAGDMLTLPPGLADIAEQEDAGRAASVQRRKELEREAKWQDMARPINQSRERSGSKGGGMQFEFDTNDPKLVSRTWKGIPDRWRASAWYSFLASSAKKRGFTITEAQLIEEFHKLQDQNSAEDVQIDVDVPRTINMHIMFRRRYRGGQRLLFRVLHAISLYFPETGYVQGMASLAATLLCYYDEERAFVMLVRLWQLRGLQQLFKPGFDGLMAALNEFETDWLQRGDVSQKLTDLGITSTAYGTRWYLTLFNMSIPFPAQLRVWDAFMLLGDAPSKDAGQFDGADLDVLHATSAALIDATREIILDSDFENAMKVLTSFVPVKDEDLLMRVARTEWKLRKKRG